MVDKAVGTERELNFVLKTSPFFQKPQNSMGAHFRPTPEYPVV